MKDIKTLELPKKDKILFIEIINVYFNPIEKISLNTLMNTIKHIAIYPPYNNFSNSYLLDLYLNKEVKEK